MENFEPCSKNSEGNKFPLVLNLNEEQTEILVFCPYEILPKKVQAHVPKGAVVVEHHRYDEAIAIARIKRNPAILDGENGGDSTSVMNQNWSGIDRVNVALWPDWEQPFGAEAWVMEMYYYIDPKLATLLMRMDKESERYAVKVIHDLFKGDEDVQSSIRREAYFGVDIDLNDEY